MSVLLNEKFTRIESRSLPSNISIGEYLEQSNDPVIKDTLGRYKRGDIDYIEALERIVILFLADKMER